MRINLIYEELRILITTYKSISVDELCQNVKIFMNDKDSDYIIINEDNVPLQSDEIINAEDKEEQTFFVLKRAGIPEPQERDSEKKIEDLIREVTGSKTTIKWVRKNKTQKDFIENVPFSENENMFEQFLQRFFRNRNDNEESIDEQIDPDTNYVNQLIEMGFTEERAREALIHEGNDINRATEYLLNG